MEKEFVLYEQALVLKELGFNEPCLASYFHAGKRLDICEYINHGEYTVLAPTFSQAFRWFREKYNLIGLIEGGYDNDKNIFTYVIWDDFRDNIVDDYYSTYEEAELACITKLIEIVKNGK